MAFEIENGVLKKFIKKRGEDEIVIPDGVTEIGERAFYRRTSIKGITLPNGLKKIGYSAFSYCFSLEYITIPDSVIKIGEEAFKYCSSLTSVAIPESVKSVGVEAFRGCKSLKKLTIFGCTVDNTLWNWDKVSFSDIKSMLDSKDYSVKMDHPTKYMFVLQVLINKKQPEAAAYVKKNFTKFAQFSIDRSCLDELKEYESLGFFTKANIGKHILYALEQENKNNELILYLLSVKDNLGGFKLEEIDKYIELALENIELTAALLEYKNKYFTPEQIEDIETDKIEKELGFRERTAAEWKKIFGYEVKDGEVTITAYKGSDIDVIVPVTICKKPVTAIADMAFSPCKPRLKKDVKETLIKLKSVYIGDNIKSFGKCIFDGCTALETITVFDKTVKLSEFGAYKGNPIKWIPLHIDPKQRTLLIISEKVIDEKPYNDKYIGVTWETCTLRRWLNEDFYSIFTDEEKAMIAETSVVNSDNASYGTKGGNDTGDKIFLLSLDKAKKYFANDSSRGVGIWWWLRSPGSDQSYAARVYHDGSLFDGGGFVHRAYGVRPALNLKF